MEAMITIQDRSGSSNRRVCSLSAAVTGSLMADESTNCLDAS